MASSHIDFKKNSQHFIIGGGNAGMIAAIQLKRAGFEPVIVDSRIGCFPFEGSITSSTLTTLKQKLGPDFTYESDTATEYYCKLNQVQSALYNLVQKLNIQIRKESFVGFTQKGLILRTSSGAEYVQDFDIAYDGTGVKRKLCKATNKLYAPQTPFTIEETDLNYVGNLFITAQFKADKKTMDRLHHFNSYLSIRPLILEILRKEFSWPHLRSPRLYSTHLKGNILNVYCEIPAGLESCNYLRWIALCFGTEKGELFALTKENLLKDFVEFEVETKQIREAIFVDRKNYKTRCIIPIGDAQHNLSFRSGIGITSAFGRFEYYLTNYLNNPSATPEGFNLQYSAFNTELNDSLRAKKLKELKSEEEMPENIPGMFADYQQHLLCLENTNQVDECKNIINLMQKYLIENKLKPRPLDQSVLLIDLQCELNMHTDNLRVAIQTRRELELILSAIELCLIKFRLILNADFKKGSYDTAIQGYKNLILLYDTVLPGKRPQIISSIYVNLALAQKNINDHSSALASLALAQKQLTEKDPKQLKIKFQQVSLLLTLASNCSIGFFEHNRVIKFYSEAQKTYKEISALLSLQQCKALDESFAKVERKHSHVKAAVVQSSGLGLQANSM